MITKSEIKYIRSLHHHKGRNKHNEFIIEGVRLINEALQANHFPKRLFFTLSFSNNHQSLLGSLKKTVPEIHEISEKELRAISDTNSPSGIIGVCEIPNKIELNTGKKDSILYLDQISDPGNMGTLLRTAAWFRIKHVVLSRNCVDAYNPKVVRSGMGSHFYIHLHSHISLKTFGTTHTIIGADQRGESQPENVTQPIVLVLGSEAHGISQKNKRYIHQFISIPKAGKGESLNVSVAGGILMEKLFQ